MYMLYQQLRSSAFAGFGVISILIPVTMFMKKRMMELTKKNMEFKDKRLKKTNEILNAIKVFKVCSISIFGHYFGRVGCPSLPALLP